VILKLSLCDVSSQVEHMYPLWWRGSGNNHSRHCIVLFVSDFFVAVFVVFDICRVDSFLAAKSLLVAALEQQRQPVLLTILIGTHADRARERCVSVMEAKSLARFYEVPYVELNVLQSVVPLIDLAVKVRE
jgi:hypothetical protein